MYIFTWVVNIFRDCAYLYIMTIQQNIGLDVDVDGVSLLTLAVYVESCYTNVDVVNPPYNAVSIVSPTHD